MSRSRRNGFGFLVFPVLVFLIPVFGVVGYTVRCGYSMEEAWSATRHFARSGTRYAQGFSEAGFEKVVPGMRGDVVFQLLGAPMEGHRVDGKPGTDWKYTLPAPDKGYFHERTVQFRVESGKPPVVEALIRRFQLAEGS